MAAARILTLNAGSSSLKVALFDAGSPPARVSGQGVSCAGAAAQVQASLEALDAHGGTGALAAVGHRIVHGGPHYASPRLVGDDVLGELHRLVALDPEHMPAALAIIEAIRGRAPGLPQVACFDTAFHRSMPRVARLLPIPRRFEDEGLQRYGFHGLSYTFLVQELARVAGEGVAQGRVVLAHLGSGASLAAVRAGRCVDTTMAFTPNSGVPMSTRSGDLDPGVVLHLQRVGGLGVEAVAELLGRRSGLLGVSETSPDMRELLERRASDPRAADAVDLFCHAVRKSIGALATTIGGLDTLVFAGGIGEHAARVRAEIARGLEHLGVSLDNERNVSSGAVISTDGSACTVRVIRTDEEAIIARDTFALIGTAP